MIQFIYNDGGRKAAGFRGETDDCVVRAITIATGGDYKSIYDELNAACKTKDARRTKRSRKGRSGSRTGIHKDIWEPFILKHWKFIWVPTMEIGSGCQVHLRASELPEGTLIVRLSRHIVAVKDRVLYDTSDCSREGTRCVYGYYRLCPHLEWPSSF